MKIQPSNLHYWTVPILVGTLSSALFMGCRKSRFLDGQPAHQESKSPHSAAETHKNLQLNSPSTYGKVELSVFPLGSWGSFGAFWRAKNLLEEAPTSLLVFPDLLDSKDLMTASPGDASGERKELAQPPSDVKDRLGLSQPEGIRFYIKNIEFISDENLLAQVPPDDQEGSRRAGRLVSTDHRETRPWVLMLNPSAMRELVAVYDLPEDQILTRLEGKSYTSPDEILSDLEAELKDRGIIGGEPTRVQKAQEVLARHLEDMTVDQTPAREVSPQPLKRSTMTLDQGGDRASFGPLQIEIGGQEAALIYNEGNDLKTPATLTLAPGLYRTVRVTWGAVAQVKGCVGVGQETLCTRDSSSPYVTMGSIKDFETHLPEFMDVPSTNDDPTWPISGDWTQEYGIDMDVKPGSVNRLSLLYPMAGSLRFHHSGYDQDLRPVMPRSRPYFYMPSLRERMMMTVLPLGRLYDFVGTATLCEPSSNQALSPCAGTLREPSGTALQIVTDSSGSPLRAFWQYQGGVDLIGTDPVGRKRDSSEGGRAAFSDPSLWLDFFSSEAGNRSPGSLVEGKEDKTALWLRPAGSLEGDSRDLVRLEGLPVALDRWLVGESKTLWAKKTLTSPQISRHQGGKEAATSQGKSKGKLQNSRPEGRELWVRVHLQRVL